MERQEKEYIISIGIIVTYSRIEGAMTSFDILMKSRIRSVELIYLYFCFRRQGRNCCSPHAISFHHVKPKMMYAMDFLIYSLKLDK